MADGPSGEVRDVFGADAADDRDGEDEAVEAGGAAAELRRPGLGEDQPDPRDGRKTLAEVTKSVKLEGDRRRGRSTQDALGLMLAGAEPNERRQLAAALERLHELLVAYHGGESRALPRERP